MGLYKENPFKVLGTSVIELMIASFLGLLIIAGILPVYLHQLAIFKYEAGLARIQENGRLSSYILARQLRSAGYMGCLKPHAFKYGKLTANLFLVGFQNNFSTSSLVLPNNVLMKIKSNTDAIQNTQLNSVIDKVLFKINKGASVISLPVKSNKLSQGLNVIADCQHAEVHKIKFITQDNIVKLTTPVKETFFENSRIGDFQTEIFYVGISNFKNSVGQPIYVLNRYVTNNPHYPQEIIEGVEDMKILYGYPDNKNMSYVTASAVNKESWGKINHLRIHLLLNSIDPVLLKPQTYVFMNKKYKSADKLLRKEWIVEIALRERL